jgi:hypothetical protein
MPSPFPGMDPYLEHPGLFSGVHQGLIAVARATLNTLLRIHYCLSTTSPISGNGCTSCNRSVVFTLTWRF